MMQQRSPGIPTGALFFVYPVVVSGNIVAGGNGYV